MTCEFIWFLILYYALGMLNFFNSALSHEKWYFFISIKFDFERKCIICRTFIACITFFFAGISIILVFSKSVVQYMWQGEISVCKVLVPIKAVPVKNDYFLCPKFELHRYQQMIGFLYWHSFYWKKIWQELIAWLMPTWIWYDLRTVSQIWPSNHELS